MSCFLTVQCLIFSLGSVGENHCSLPLSEVGFIDFYWNALGWPVLSYMWIETLSILNHWCLIAACFIIVSQFFGSNYVLCMCTSYYNECYHQGRLHLVLVNWFPCIKDLNIFTPPYYKGIRMYATVSFSIIPLFLKPCVLKTWRISIHIPRSNCKSFNKPCQGHLFNGLMKHAAKHQTTISVSLPKKSLSPLKSDSAILLGTKSKCCLSRAQIS